MGSRRTARTRNMIGSRRGLWDDSKRAVVGVPGSGKRRLGVPWRPDQMQFPEFAVRLMTASPTSRPCVTMTLVLAYKVRLTSPFAAGPQSESYFVAFGRKVSLVS